jgi:TRAP-type C4-dicarboxylate transport system permease small subunit
LHYLEVAARWCAYLGGCLLSLIAVMTCTSVIGRDFFDATLAGDFELTGVAAGLAIALFLPLCQVRRGNIAVDFFTARASTTTQAHLDNLGALLLAGVMVLLSWRTTLGGINAWSNHSGSMLLGFPDWIIYAGMAPPMLLTAVIALWQTRKEAV